MYEPPVRQERSGWRDEAISRRHREWGYNLPIFDLDFLVAEYDCCRPVALVEYKNERAAPEDFNSANYRTMIELADGYREGIPAISVRYAADLSWYLVTPLNAHARVWYAELTRQTEGEFINFLYRIRRRRPPAIPFDANHPLRSHRLEEDAA